MRNLDIISEADRWRLPRFFSENIGEASNIASVSKDDSKHIKNVLRMREGDFAVICDGKGIDYLCKLVSIDLECKFSIENKRKNLAEPVISIRLFQALPKGDKMDFIVQKAVELGATEIIPVMTKRCVSRPDKKSMAKKLERFNRISYEASKQCGRGIVPIVRELVDFKQAISMINGETMGIIFYECGGEKLNNLINFNKNIDIFIGSEGGFEESEVDFAIKNGWKIATLGNRILRCETAPIVALALLMNLTEN